MVELDETGNLDYRGTLTRKEMLLNRRARQAETDTLLLFISPRIQGLHACRIEDIDENGCWSNPNWRLTWLPKE